MRGEQVFSHSDSPGPLLFLSLFLSLGDRLTSALTGICYAEQHFSSSYFPHYSHIYITHTHANLTLSFSSASPVSIL